MRDLFLLGVGLVAQFSNRTGRAHSTDTIMLISGEIRLCCNQVTLNKPPEINAVAKIDFERSMARLGFTSDEASKIDRWLTEKTYETAAAAAERIAQLGLSVGTSDQDRIRKM